MKDDHKAITLIIIVAIAAMVIVFVSVGAF